MRDTREALAIVMGSIEGLMEGQQHDTEVVERPEISAGKGKSADSSAVENAVPEAPIDSDNSPLTENDLFNHLENIPSVLHVQSEEDLYEILDCMGFIQGALSLFIVAHLCLGIHRRHQDRRTIISLTLEIS